MFSGTIVIRKLKLQDITDQVASDMSFLLRQQHRKAKRIDVAGLTRLARRRNYRVMAGWHDDRLIATSTLVTIPLASHTFASMHNLIIRKGYDPRVIGMRLFNEMTTGLRGVEYVDAGAGLQDEGMMDVLVALKFRELSPRFRLRLNGK